MGWVIGSGNSYPIKDPVQEYDILNWFTIPLAELDSEYAKSILGAMLCELKNEETSPLIPDPENE
jgi:hypothetical protein